MRKFFGFGSSTPPPPAPPTRPPSLPTRPGASAAPEEKPTLVGRWKEPKGKDTTEFHADGKVTEKPASGENIRGTYTLDGSKLKIQLEGVPDALSFSAVVNGDKLEMTDPDGQTTRYERIS
ncbi:MAG: DUF5640 domain-containing protein [Chthoniobacterales bacterium]